MKKTLAACRPSPALAVAMLALFSSLAGGATAAKLITGKQIANKSITGKDVKPRSLTGKHVKNGSLARKDFKKGLLLAGGGAAGPRGLAGATGARGAAGADGMDGVDGVGGATGERGPTGFQGERGLAGEDGEPGVKGEPGVDGQVGPEGAVGSAGPEGPAGATSVVTRYGSDTNVQSSMSANVSVSCHAGERAVSGGASNGGALDVFLKQSHPTPTGNGSIPTGWAATYENESAELAAVRAWVVCVSP